jgi:hypothetical protein
MARWTLSDEKVIGILLEEHPPDFDVLYEDNSNEPEDDYYVLRQQKCDTHLPSTSGTSRMLPVLIVESLRVMKSGVNL